MSLAIKVRTFNGLLGPIPGLEVCLLAIGGSGALLLGVGENRIHVAETVADKIMISVQRNQG